MSYLEQLHENLKRRNLQIEPYAEVFKWYNLLMEENKCLRKQLDKNNKLLQRNSFELRYDSELADIQKENANMLSYKFSTNLMNKKIEQGTFTFHTDYF